MNSLLVWLECKHEEVNPSLLVVFVFSSNAVSGTKPNTVYMDDQALEPVLSLIDHAQTSIYIEMYNFTNTHDKDEQNNEVVQCLLNKLTENTNNKIDIKIIIDGKEAANRPPEQKGKPTGFPESAFEEITPGCIKWDVKSGKMHRKVAVVDGTDIFIGSTNWTKTGFKVNREIDVLLQDTQLAKQISDEFKKRLGCSITRLSNQRQIARISNTTREGEVLYRQQQHNEVP